MADEQEKPRRRGRKGNPAERREAILTAALDRFLADGFAATTLESIARQARVAKGTIYLYFADKEALFRALIQDRLVPLIRNAELLVPTFQGSLRELMRQTMLGFAHAVLGSDRQRLLRLVVSEAPRFPWLAEIYWQEIVSRGVKVIRAAARRAAAQGQIARDSLERFPQLIAAPLIMAFLWSLLFERFEPLDRDAFIETYIELLLKGLEAPPP